MNRLVIGIASVLMVGALCGCDASVEEDVARLDIAPEPDSMLRVFMAWQPLDKPLEITPPTFVPFVREGFTAVEWRLQKYRKQTKKTASAAVN